MLATRASSFTAVPRQNAIATGAQVRNGKWETESRDTEERIFFSCFSVGRILFLRVTMYIGF